VQRRRDERGVGVRDEQCRGAVAVPSPEGLKTFTPPTVYGTAARASATTGTRRAIASTSGTPNPSCSLTTNSAAHDRYSAFNRAGETRPVSVNRPG